MNFFKIKEDKNNTNEKEINEIINNESEIFLLILDLFEMMFNQSISGYKSIDKLYHSFSGYFTINISFYTIILTF